MRESQVRDYAAACALADERLRDLLRHGEAVERVWAIWALAQRAADPGELAARLAGEPSAGVRRALVVVLAGHDHTDLLVAFARHDPDPEVRAGAMRLVIRFAEAGRVPWSIVADALARDDAAVQLVIAGELRSGAPAELLARLPLLLDHDDGAVRREAFDALFGARARDPSIDATLVSWLARCDPRDLELALIRWRSFDGDAALAHAMSGASRQVRDRVLTLIGARSWARVAPLLQDDPELFRSYAWSLRADWYTVPLHLLLDCGGWIEDHREVFAALEARMVQLEDRDPRIRASLARFAGRCDVLIEKQRELEAAQAEGHADPYACDLESEACEELCLGDPDGAAWIARLRDLARRLARD